MLKAEREERRRSNRGSRTKIKQEEAGMIGNCWLDGITQPVVHISADSFILDMLSQASTRRGADAINPELG